MTGLTDKAAERMKQVLLSGGEQNSAPIPGIPGGGRGSPSSNYLASDAHASSASAMGGAPVSAGGASSVAAASQPQPFKDSMLARGASIGLGAGGGLASRRASGSSFGSPTVSPFRGDATEVGAGGADPRSPEVRGVTPAPGSPTPLGTPGGLRNGVSIFQNSIQGSINSPQAVGQNSRQAYMAARGHTAGRPRLSAFGAPATGLAPSGPLLPNVDVSRSTFQPRNHRSQTASTWAAPARGAAPAFRAPGSQALRGGPSY